MGQQWGASWAGRVTGGKSVAGTAFSSGAHSLSSIGVGGTKRGAWGLGAELK